MSGLLSFELMRFAYITYATLSFTMKSCNWIGSIGLVWGRNMVTYSFRQVALILFSQEQGRVCDGSVISVADASQSRPPVGANTSVIVGGFWVGWRYIAIYEQGTDLVRVRKGGTTWRLLIGVAT